MMVPLVPLALILMCIVVIAARTYEFGQLNALKRVKRIVKEYHTDDVGAVVVEKLEVELGVREARKPPTGEYDA